MFTFPLSSSCDVVPVRDVSVTAGNCENFVKCI